MPLRRPGRDLSKVFFVYPWLWIGSFAYFLLALFAENLVAEPLIVAEELRRAELLLTPSARRLMTRVYSGNTEESLGDYFRSVLDRTGHRPMYVLSLRTESGRLLALTVLHQDLIGSTIYSHARLHLYIPDEILFNAEYHEQLRNIFAMNLGRAFTLHTSRIPILTLGPEELLTPARRRVHADYFGDPNLDVEGAHSIEDNRRTSRLSAINRIVGPLGFHSTREYPRLIPTNAKNDSSVPLNRFPRVILNENHFHFLSGYQWFGAPGFAEPQSDGNRAASLFHRNLAENFFAILSSGSERVMGPLLAEHPELHPDHLALGVTAYHDEQTMAFQAASFRDRFGPRLRSTILLLANAGLDGQKEAAFITALEQLIRRETSTWLLSFLPTNGASIRILLGSSLGSEEERLQEKVREWLEHSKIREELKSKGIRVDLTNHSRREREQKFAARSEWRTFDFPDSSAFSHVRAVAVERSVLAILELRTFQLQGSRYQRWQVVARIPLAAPLQDAPPSALTRRHLVFPLDGAASDLHLLRGPKGWRAELRPFCQKFTEPGAI